jgi:hypothetical protein
MFYVSRFALKKGETRNEKPETKSAEIPIKTQKSNNLPFQIIIIRLHNTYLHKFADSQFFF